MTDATTGPDRHDGWSPEQRADLAREARAGGEPSCPLDGAPVAHEAIFDGRPMPRLRLRCAECRSEHVFDQ